MSIAIDSDIVNNGIAAEGISIGLDRFSLSIEPSEDDLKRRAIALLDGSYYGIELWDASIRAEVSWFLCDKEGKAWDGLRIAYAQLEKGDYAWAFFSESSLNLEALMISERVNLMADDIINTDGSSVSISDEEEERDLEILNLN